MDSEPKTRRESKKDKREKASEPYKQKHIRTIERLRTKKQK